MSEKHRVFATGDIGTDALDRLRKQGYEVDLYEGPGPPPQELVREKLRTGVDALITTIRDRIDASVLEAGGDRLKLVAQYAVGYDNIDVEAAGRLEIAVSNTPDVLSATTAEFALFMMGALSRKLIPSEELVRRGEWTEWHPYLPFLGDEVNGKTVAVIGAGRIGSLFADYCLALDMDLLLYSRSPLPDLISRFRSLAEVRRRLGFSQRRPRIDAVDFESCLKQADFVSIHVPLTEETRFLFDRDAFRKMKPGAYLINTSRGPVVDESALCQALLANEIAGAALDVFAVEPLPSDSPLRDPRLNDRLRLYHHFGSGGTRTRLSPDPDEGMAGRCVQAVIDVLEGHYDGDFRRIPHIVNAVALSP